MRSSQGQLAQKHFLSKVLMVGAAGAGLHHLCKPRVLPVTSHLWKPAGNYFQSWLRIKSNRRWWWMLCLYGRGCASRSFLWCQGMAVRNWKEERDFWSCAGSGIAEWNKALLSATVWWRRTRITQRWSWDTCSSDSSTSVFSLVGFGALREGCMKHGGISVARGEGSHRKVGMVVLVWLR